MTQLGLNAVCVPSQDVVARVIEGDLVIVPLVAGIGAADDELFTLNDTGKAIWDRLDGKKTLKDVAAELAAEYEAPIESIESDVLGLTTELFERKMLVKVTPETASELPNPTP